ncbi:MAG: hypothetical protein M1814_004599 [Vezdaea aestivalis]|nr:MAG: hypothetical protein M1814_004599 [Vezdaea aestivalis]
MPSFFFHLKLELFAGSAYQGPLHSFLPSPGADIFTASLPYHSPSTHSDTDSTYSPGPSKDHLPAKPHSTPGHINPSDASLEEANGPFSAAISHRSILKSIPQDPDTARDYRFERVTIESINMEPSPVAAPDDKTRAGSSSSGAHLPSEGMTFKPKHTPSKVKTTEVGYGIVRLYRDAEETIGLYDDAGERPPAPGGSDMTASAIRVKAAKSPGWREEDCKTLGILAVPSYLTPSDFLGWIGEKTREDVSHIRMIKTGRINRYMVLVKFRQAKKAREWRKEWNGKVFNSTEPETCMVVFIKSVRFETPDSDPSQFPENTNDPFTSNRGSNMATSAASGGASSALTVKPLAPPTPALVELPTCPVCLERMDETTGLLTILCQHVFHCACLQKWRGSGCPVCRFTQGSFSGRGRSEYASCKDDEDDCSKQICSICASDSNLWICLICGNVGCGRYDEAHAMQHYRDTSHCYVMEIDTQRVWDYAGDGFVHRLIQSETGGRKLVELPCVLGVTRRADNDEESDDNTDGYVPRQKLLSIGEEYTHLLTSQLESQRQYFEEKVAQAADKASRASAAAEAAAARAEVAAATLADLEISRGRLVKETVPGLEREVGRLERRATKAGEAAKELEKKWKEEVTVNQSLMERVKFMESEMEKVRVERDDLAEQNRDLGFFISGAQKLKEAGVGEDVVEGRLEVGEAQADKGPAKKKGKGRKK